MTEHRRGTPRAAGAAAGFGAGYLALVRPRLLRWGATELDPRAHPAARGRTRLVVSGYGHLEPRWLQGPLGVLVMEPAHRVMQTRQFAQLRSRVERGGGEAVTAGTAAASPPAPAIR